MTITPDQLRMSPYEVAEETFVIPWMVEAPPVGLFCMNSLVIRGEQPRVVDTEVPPTGTSGWRTSAVSSTRTMSAGSS